MSAVQAAPPTGYRQSTLASLEECPRRTWFALNGAEDVTTGYTEASADLGTVVHAVFAEILRTLYRHGECQMSTQEAVEVMYEVYAASPITLPADERESLRILTLGFADRSWDPRRILALEQRLSTEIVCQDGQARTLTGQPDVLLADPPDGLIIIDYKSGWGVPRRPRQAPAAGEAITGAQYLSDRGHFQLDCYGLLALREYPAAGRVTLRELPLRYPSEPPREATLTREDLEHVERELGVSMMHLERGLQEGAASQVWKPRPGRHCARKCPVARSCPVPAEQRGAGAVESPQDADREAARFVTVDALRTQMRDALKAFHERTGYAPQVGDGTVVRWAEKPGGGRSFGIHPPDTGRADPVDALTGMARAAAERRAGP